MAKHTISNSIKTKGNEAVSTTGKRKEKKASANSNGEVNLGNGGELHQVAGDTGRYAQPVINALSELAHEFFR